MASNEESWIDLLMSVGKEMGFDVPPQARNWARPSWDAEVVEDAVIVETAEVGNRLVGHTKPMSRQELADMFDDLAGKVRSGEVSLGADGYRVALRIPDQVSMDLAAVSNEQGDGSEIELAIVVSWQAQSGVDETA